jgi:hypothetical protein
MLGKTPFISNRHVYNRPLRASHDLPAHYDPRQACLDLDVEY